MGISPWIADIEATIGVEFFDRQGKGRGGDRAEFDDVAAGPTQLVDDLGKVPLCCGAAVTGYRNRRILFGRCWFLPKADSKRCRKSTGQTRIETLMEVSGHSLVVQKVGGVFRMQCTWELPLDSP